MYNLSCLSSNSLVWFCALLTQISSTALNPQVEIKHPHPAACTFQPDHYPNADNSPSRTPPQQPQSPHQSSTSQLQQYHPAQKDIGINCPSGSSLTYDSCVDAFNSFQETRTRNLTVGARAPPGPSGAYQQYDLQLPVRWITGT